MDFTQRIEIELGGNQTKPRLLLLATLTGLAVNDSAQPPYLMPSITISSSGDSNGHQSDTETYNDSLKLLNRRPSRVNSYSHPDTLCANSEDCASYLKETDAEIVEHYVSSIFVPYKICKTCNCAFFGRFVNRCKPS